MNMNVKEEKTALRRQCALVRDGIDVDQRKQYDRKIVASCLSLAVFRYADKVLCYHPIRSEVDLRPLIEGALSLGKEVYLPLVHANEKGRMTFHRVRGEEDLVKGSFGVMEPRADLPLYEEDGRSAVAFLPGLAYDKNGMRLGYGKGYYDRFLSSFQGTAIGVCHSALILAAVPHNRYDLRADLVVSEKGVILTREI